MSARVIQNTPAYPLKTTWEGSSHYTDIIGSPPEVKSPIVCGFWALDDSESDGRVIEQEWDEVKYVTAGQVTVKDVETGIETLATVGSMIWLPKGARTVFSNPRGLKAMYVEQRAAENVDIPTK